MPDSGDKQMAYRIEKYDISKDYPEKNGAWRIAGRRKTKRGAVKLIRKLTTCGYDRDTSIYVEKEER
jgi:hypothetical protein